MYISTHNVLLIELDRYIGPTCTCNNITGQYKKNNDWVNIYMYWFVGFLHAKINLTTPDRI